MAQSGGQYDHQYDHQQMHHNGENMINSDYGNQNAVSEYDAGAGGEAHHQDQAQHHSLAELLQRSGNFSSIEDEPQGGQCEKKGLVEKIKEKVPGIGNKEQPHNTHPTTGTATGATSGGGYDTHHEKKGIMNKIKDKLPGTH